MRNYCRFGIPAVMNNCQITKQRKLITTRKTSFKHNNNYDELQSSVFGLELPPRSALSMPQPESRLTTQCPMAMSANWRVKDVHWNYGAIYNLRRKNSSLLQCVRSAVNTPCIIHWYRPRKNRCTSTLSVQTGVVFTRTESQAKQRLSTQITLNSQNITLSKVRCCCHSFSFFRPTTQNNAMCAKPRRHFEKVVNFRVVAVTWPGLNQWTYRQF